MFTVHVSLIFICSGIAWFLTSAEGTVVHTLTVMLINMKEQSFASSGILFFDCHQRKGAKSSSDHSQPKYLFQPKEMISIQIKLNHDSVRLQCKNTCRKLRKHQRIEEKQKAKVSGGNTQREDETKYLMQFSQDCLQSSHLI